MVGVSCPAPESNRRAGPSRAARTRRDQAVDARGLGATCRVGSPCTPGRSGCSRAGGTCARRPCIRAWRAGSTCAVPRGCGNARTPDAGGTRAEPRAARTQPGRQAWQATGLGSGHPRRHRVGAVFRWMPSHTIPHGEDRCWEVWRSTRPARGDDAGRGAVRPALRGERAGRVSHQACRPVGTDRIRTKISACR